MKWIKEILRRGFHGVFIGIVLVMTIGVISILVSGNTDPISANFFVRQYITGAVMGFCFGIFNLLFQVEKLGLTGATILHFIGQAIVFYPMAKYAGWIGTDATTLAVIAIEGTIIYFIIWIICYIGWQRDIKEINKNLNR